MLERSMVRLSLVNSGFGHDLADLRQQIARTVGLGEIRGRARVLGLLLVAAQRDTT